MPTTTCSPYGTRTCRVSEEPDLPYHGSKMYIPEDRPKVEACQGEQPSGLRLWRVDLANHFFIPQSSLNGEISWGASGDPEDRRCFYIEDNAIDVVDFLNFDPGSSWEHHRFADEPLRK